MIRYDRRVWILSALSSALAGYVDALGFLTTGGSFVSFMSGNTTRLGVGLAEGSTLALAAAGLVASFVGGVALGSLAGAAAKRWRRPVALALVAVLLAAAAALDATLPLLAIHVTAFAMGAENTVFERQGEVTIGLTYMTGTLVKLGQRLTTALLGGPRWTWVPYLLLWLGLMLGAVTGALVHPHLGLAGLWYAAGFAAVLAGGSAAFVRG